MSGDTCIRSVASFACCHLFSSCLEALFFFSHPLVPPRLPPQVKHKCVSSRGQVSIQDKCPQSSTMTVTTTTKPLVVFQVSRFKEPNPQPESAAVGSAAAISPVSKRVRLLCLLFGCLNALAHELVLAANVGPKHNKPSYFTTLCFSDHLYRSHQSWRGNKKM